MPEARVIANATYGNLLIVSWPPATNRNFLDSYIVSYTTSTPGNSTRRQRQTLYRSVQVSSDQTSVQLEFIAYNDYIVNVDTLYTPPPNGSIIAVGLVPTTTFRSPERRMKLLFIAITQHNTHTHTHTHTHTYSLNEC